MEQKARTTKEQGTFGYIHLRFDIRRVRGGVASEAGLIKGDPFGPVE